MLSRNGRLVVWRRVLVCALLLVALVPLPLAAGLRQQDPELVQIQNHDIRTQLDVDGQVVLSLEFEATAGGSLDADRQQLIASLPATIEVLPSPTTVAALSVRVFSSDDVAILQGSSLIRSIVLPPSAPLFVAQQRQSAELNVARPLVGADQMHQVNVRGQGQIIAVIDSGVEASHPDLASSIIFEGCFVPVGDEMCPNGTDLQTGPGAARDDDGHGTNIAGMLASDGIIAPTGIAPDAQLEIYKVGGPASLSFDDTLLALDYILANRPQVQAINFSIASTRLFPGPCARSIWPAFYDVVSALRDRGTIVVAPTGNQFATGQTAFPACLEPVVSVAASTVREGLLPASNIDNATDLAAPGQDITTTSLGASVEAVSGTSFSVPIVVACAVLIVEDDGGTAVDAMARLTSGRLRSGRDGYSTPWINCAPRCAGKSATVNLELGQEPTSGDDVILGTRGNDAIIAGRGDDTICGLDGDDTITAGFGNDTVLGGKGNDIVFGGGGNDQINAQLGNDYVDGGDGDDNLYGSWGDDVIKGGPGTDFISGKAGKDDISAGDGDDLVLAGRGSDTVSGGAGNDLLLLGRGSDSATGGDGDDRLVGAGGWDYLDGGNGIDECFAGFGQDQAVTCETVTGVP